MLKGVVVAVVLLQLGEALRNAGLERRPEVLTALGIHPHEAGREGLDDPAPLEARDLPSRVLLDVRQAADLALEGLALSRRLMREDIERRAAARPSCFPCFAAACPKRSTRRAS